MTRVSVSVEERFGKEAMAKAVAEHGDQWMTGGECESCDCEIWECSCEWKGCYGLDELEDPDHDEIRKHLDEVKLALARKETN